MSCDVRICMIHIYIYWIYIIFNFDRRCRTHVMCCSDIYDTWYIIYICIYPIKKTDAPGKKQHGHKIARTDWMNGARKSITILTTTWSDGSPGPLGICTPENFLRQDKINELNERFRGRAHVICSETKTHFMNSSTWVVLLKGLLTDAFALQRKRYGLPENTQGLLLCDGWTGFHAWRDGSDQSRHAWGLQNHVTMADPQSGGWSACAQPCDQVHHLLRARLDLVDASEAGCYADLRSRRRYDEMAVRPSGQPMHQKIDTVTLIDRSVHAWESMSQTQHMTWCFQACLHIYIYTYTIYIYIGILHLFICIIHHMQESFGTNNTVL